MTDASKPTKRAPASAAAAPARAVKAAPARKTAARKTAAASPTAAAAGAAPRKAATTRTTPARTTAAGGAPVKKAAARKAPAKKAVARKAATKKAAVAAKRGGQPDHSHDDQDQRAGDATGSGTPHRPSRRHLIVDAAIRVFARKGFSEASIQEIADDAGVVATAVYYHFAGKEELFEAALTRGLDASDAVIAAARPDDAHADAQIFRSVIRASWDWAESSPDMARLLFLHMPGGATPVARTLARDYLERHARRAYDYFESAPIPNNRRRAAAEYAARTLTVRTVMGLTLSVHSLQMDGGPLSSVSSAKMVDATARLCERIFKGA